MCNNFGQMTFGRKRNGQPRNCWRRWRVYNVHELLRNNVPLFTEKQIIPDQNNLRPRLEESELVQVNFVHHKPCLLLDLISVLAIRP